jgi:hypothetical protein
MRYYELTINTKEADALSEKVTSYLPNPAVQEQKNPSFLTLEFYAEPEKIPELEKNLKADSLKYLILVKELPKRISEMEPETTGRRGTGWSLHETKRVVAKSKPKVELKEIEKKLEEILEE